MTHLNKPVVIGIAGGTGSGKSTVAKSIFGSFPEEQILIIPQDAYYRDQSHLTFDERVQTNYDHPLAFDNELLIEHISGLLNEEAIDMPVYNFANHNREEDRVRVEPKKIIILEGIMILFDEKLRELMDVKIFVDTDADIRILRRIERDMNERGRTLESVMDQYMNTVKPAHEQFVEPSKKYADLIIPEGGYNKVAIDIMVANLRDLLTRD